MLEAADIIVPDWPAPRGVKALFTTRLGGVSVGDFASLNLGAHVGDDPAAVVENRRRLRELLPVTPQWLNQIHGCAVHTIVDADVRASARTADAQLTSLSGFPCAVRFYEAIPFILAEARRLKPLTTLALSASSASPCRSFFGLCRDPHGYRATA